MSVNALFKRKHFGAAMTEMLVALPALLLVGLGGLQTALIYDAKTTINYATFEAARAGAVSHAQTDAIRQELGIRLAPLFGGDGSPRKAIAAMTRSSLEVQDTRFTQIEIINPTVEAFEDFGRDIVDPQTNDAHFGIPNSHLRWRAQDVSNNSGVNIQDANLLKIKTTYGFELKVPLMDRVITAVMRRFDPENTQYYNAGRIPITSVATVRMQSDAWPDENNVHTSDDDGVGGTPATSDEEGNAGDESSDSEDGQGGDDDTPETGDAGTNPGTVSGDTGDGSGNGNGDDEDNFTDDNVSEDDLPPVDESENMGVPSCDDESTQGDDTQSPTSQTSGLASTYVGNPINVVTGNKYQQEVDMPPLPGVLGLLFKRHYNSQSHDAGEIGYGWRHSYEVTLSKTKTDNFRVRQSDGRVIHFNKTEREGYYEAERVKDGWLIVREKQFDWYWRNGQRLQFDVKGHLTRIATAAGQSLDLFYNNSDRLFLVRDPQGREMSIDHYPNGRMKAIYDPSGSSTKYRYDEVGNLANVIRSDGYERVYHYEDANDRHNLTGITDERGQRYATWSYDVQDRAVYSSHIGKVGEVSLDFSNPGETKVTDSQGRVSTYMTEMRNGTALVNAIYGPGCSSCGQGDVTYRYNSQFQMIEKTTLDGVTTRFHYDGKNRLVEITKSAIDKGKKVVKVVAKYAYKDDSILPIVITEPSINPERMHQWWLEYNQFGQVKEIFEVGYTPDYKGGYNEISRTTKYEYQGSNLAAVDGPLPGDADLRTYEYDNKGRLVKVIAPHTDAPSIEAFDVYGRPSKFTSPDGSDLTMKYNSAGLITHVERKRNTRTITKADFEYDPVGNLIAVNGPLGRVEMAYDAEGRPKTMVYPDGRTRQWQWDTESRLLGEAVLSSSGANELEASYIYDEHSNLVEYVKNNSDKSLYQYNNKGKLVRQIDPQGIVTDYLKDPFDQVLEITRAVGTSEETTEKFTYDAKQLPVGIEDGRGNSVRQGEDDFGRPLWRTIPDSGTVLYTYNNQGLKAGRVDENGNVTRYEYDQQGRLTGVGGISQPVSTQFTYQVGGQLSSIDDVKQHTRYGYNEQKELTEIEIQLDNLPQSYLTKYSYDEYGRVVEKRLPNGQTVLFEYSSNSAKQPVRIVRKGWLKNPSIIDRMEFDQEGRISSVAHTSGTGAEYEYDAFGRLSEMRIPNGEKRSYEYDLLNRIVEIRDNNRVTRYVYDALGRLVEEQSADHTYSWEYDKSGNRTTMNRDGVATEYRYDESSNRMLQTNGMTISYNANGAPVQRGELKYVYNTAGRPLQVYRSNKLIADYTYNSQGERIKKTVYNNGISDTTYYLYESKRLVAELDGKGDVKSYYLYRGNAPVALLKGDDIYAIHSDHRGAPVMVMDDSGNTVWQAEYDSFGQARIFNTANNDQLDLNLRLPGQYYDAETKTHYNINRDYDPDTGRFLTSDPIGFADGLNTYAYVGNDPINRVDPLGLYGENIHYYMMNFLAQVAGLDDMTVQIISTASQYIDDNSLTSPMSLQGISAGSLSHYHFILPREDVPNIPNFTFDFTNPSNIQLDNLKNAAMMFDFDACVINHQHSRYVKAQLYGEYLHAYADTYGHRDNINNPYSPNSWAGGIGHALDGTLPDRTYNFVTTMTDELGIEYPYEYWNSQEARTLEAERQIFLQLREDFRTEIENERLRKLGPGTQPLTDAQYQQETDQLWLGLAGLGGAAIGVPGEAGYQPAVGETSVLQDFNNEVDESRKLDLLNGFLRDMMGIYKPIENYHESIGRNNRDQLLAGFELGDLPGVLLPAPVEEDPYDFISP